MAKSTKKGKQKAPGPAPPPAPVQAPVQITRMIEEDEEDDYGRQLSTINEDPTWGAGGGGGYANEDAVASDAWPMTTAPGGWLDEGATNPAAHEAWGTSPRHMNSQWGPTSAGPSPIPPVGYFATAPNSPAQVPLQAQHGAKAWAAWGHEAGMKGPTPAPAHQTFQAAAPPRTTQANIPGWQSWGAEVTGRGYKPSAAATAATAAYQTSQPRVAFADGPTLIPHRSDMSDHARSALLKSVLEQQLPPQVQPQRKQSKRNKKATTTTTQYQDAGWGQQQDDPWGSQDQGPWGQGQQTGDQWGNDDYAQPQKGRRREKQSHGGGRQQPQSGWGEEVQGGWGKPEGQGRWDQQEAHGAWATAQDGPWGGGGQDDYGKRADEWNDYDESEEWEKVEGVGDNWGDWSGGEHQSELLDDPGRHRRVNSLVHAPPPKKSATMPSRTMAYAAHHSPDFLTSVDPVAAQIEKRERKHSGTHKDPPDLDGEGLKPLSRALFGRHRKARDRIKWWFPSDKDPNVKAVIQWIRDPQVSEQLGAYGLDRFLRSRERGAFFVNASYAPESTEPAVDWLSWDHIVETRDRMLQEFVGYYDPAEHTLLFVLLPSKTGNSVAIWREKVEVPANLRVLRARDVELAKAALKKDYPVTVDEWPSPQRTTRSISAESAPKKKKKGFFRRLFRPLFRIEW
ncbi:uncharacterized protein STEHIDRAFT_167775 [Stereum hirsutum FP-91666 SS1]|uniref:uncharacterized protein n=1 Tax=Stereum hirsutum (strain FP-91666) TaxID=721885 RepID=UPI000440D18A|nr:uncharacterized protein STEHIDRAFT_167775 [Stereum hirsutum FP-91666 SS1]EIM88496.1 hypothetical protein STEHIDRAFT_167775 [Stereum hirsutum FP-91666 SS1]